MTGQNILPTLGGLQMLHTWTRKPFCALLTRPVFGVILGWKGPAVGCKGMGLWGPPPVDDEAADPYPGRSIESLLVVLRRRADGLVVGTGKDDGEVEGEDEMAAAGAAPAPASISAPVPVPVPVLDVDAAADLGPREEGPRRLGWAAGAGWLISFSVARSGLLTCRGFACRLVSGFSSGPALAGLLGPLSLLLWGGRPSAVWWSSTSIIKLRLAMMGDSGLSNWKPDAKLGLHSPAGTAVTNRRYCSSRSGNKQQENKIKQ